METLEIHPLAPERLGDYLAFFDGEAFSDNPKWASCYCFAYHFTGKFEDWDMRTAAENRAASSALITGRALRGYLAYQGGSVVGWCQAAPKATVHYLSRVPEVATPEDPRIGSLMCFLIAPRHRRGGIARRLLERACEGFAAEGFDYAEAYPRKAQTDAATSYEGPVPLLEDMGFTLHRDCGRFRMFRKSLRH